MAVMSAVDFLVRSLVSLILRECPANTLFWANVSPAPPALTPFMLLPLSSSLLLHHISFLLLSFFLRFLSSFSPKPGSDPASEYDTVTTVAGASVSVVVSPVIFVILPLQCSLLNASKALPKVSFVFDHPESPCKSVVAPTPKLLERQYDLWLIVVPYWYLPSPSPSFQPISPYLLSHIPFVSVPHILCVISIPDVPHIRHCARLPPSSPLTLSVLPIILHLQCASVVILPRLCFVPHHIIFHRPVYFSAAVICLPSRIGSSPSSVLFCTTLLAPLCSTLLFSLSTLIFSLRFFLLFLKVYSFSTWCSCSAPIWSVFFHLPSLCFTLIWSPPQLCLIRSACSISDLLNSDCSSHALICLLWSAWISSLRYTLSFFLLDLLISLKITHHYVIHHLLLTCIIT